MLSCKLKGTFVDINLLYTTARSTLTPHLHYFFTYGNLPVKWDSFSVTFFLFHLARRNEQPQYYILFVRYNNHSNATLINLYLYSTTVTSGFIHTVLRFVSQSLCFAFKNPGLKLAQKFAYSVVIVWFFFSPSKILLG